MAKSLSQIAASLMAGTVLAACSNAEPPAPAAAPASAEVSADELACRAAFDKTLYAINPPDKSSEAAAARKAISGTPEEGRTLLNGCAALWKREARQLDGVARNTMFGCSDLRDTLIRVGQIENTGVPKDETRDLRGDVEGVFVRNCAGVPLLRR